MSSRLDELKKLKEQINMHVNGLENYDKDSVNLFISNHNCLMDIFYVPMAIEDPMLSLVSARLMYKKELERQRLVNEALYAMPIEAHGGKVYSRLCLENATKMLSLEINASIFPEGAYVEDKGFVNRGRTGASRILFDAKLLGQKVKLIPVSIDIKGKIIDMDSYCPKNEEVTINILPEIDYLEDFEKYLSTDDSKIKNEALHSPIDKSLKKVAESLNKTYKNEYIELFPKKTVIFSDGSLVDTNEAQKEEYVERYKKDLTMQRKILIKSMFKSKN